MSDAPANPDARSLNDPAATFLLRWRGRQEGPYPRATIEAKLAANQIGLLHEINYLGRWVTLRDYFAEQDALIRAELQAAEQQRARAEDERQLKAREESSRTPAENEKRPSPIRVIPVQKPATPSGSLAVLQKFLLLAFFVASLLTFFLPNVVLTMPFFGPTGVSMFDFVKPKPATATPDASKKETPKPTSLDFNSFQTSNATTGGLLGAVAVFGLMGHYLLTIVWALLEFGFRKRVNWLTTVWLSLALQFPLLLSIAVHLTMNSIKAELSKTVSTTDANELATTVGNAFLNNTTIGPGFAMWFLMALALVIIGLRYWEKNLKPSRTQISYGTIPD